MNATTNSSGANAVPFLGFSFLSCEKEDQISHLRQLLTLKLLLHIRLWLGSVWSLFRERKDRRHGSLPNKVG